MIHSVYLMNPNGLLLFQRQLTPQAKTLTKEGDMVASFLSAITTFASHLGQKTIESMVFNQYKFLCGNFGLIFVVFYVDKQDDEYKLREKMKRVGEAFLLKYENVLLNWNNKIAVFQNFEIDEILKSTIKVVFMGLPGVGKTTICNLINGAPISLDYIPTIGVGLSDLMISGDCQVSVWDLAGQEQFQAFWKDYLEEADIVFVVTDSQKENVYNTLDLYEKNKKFTSASTNFYVIANKQDLPDSLTPEDIQEIFYLPTYDMVAINPQNRKRMLTILRKKVGEKAGNQLAVIESKISGKEQIYSVLSSIEGLKINLVKILDLEDPIFQTINFWIDKLKYYPLSTLKPVDYTKLTKELEVWKTLSTRTISKYVSEEKVLKLIDDIDQHQKAEALEQIQEMYTSKGTPKEEKKKNKKKDIKKDKIKDKKKSKKIIDDIFEEIDKFD